MSRKVIILLFAIAGGCGGVGGSAPAITAEELRDGSVGETLDVLMAAVDQIALDTPGGDVRVRGEPARILVDTADDGSVTVEVLTTRRTEATLRLEPDPDLGLGITGTIVTESPDGTLVEGTLERVFVRAVADLPDVGNGALFTSGNVDLSVRAGDGALLATGTAALIGRRAVVSLTVDGTSTESEQPLGQ
jgi:hypothetical protein